MVSSKIELRSATSRPLVSVVMSVHNAQEYIKEAIESVLGQTFEDFELIVINDGSTDGTCQILESLARRDARICIVHQKKNRGLTRSLNSGIRHASGEYVARMDADDIALPERLERQVEILKTHVDIGVLGTLTDYIDSEGNLTGRSWPRWSPPVLNGWRSLFESVVCHPSVMMRRSILQRLDGYNESVLRAQDYELWSRALFETRIGNVTEKLLLRRRTADAITVRFSDEQEETVLRAMACAVSRLLESHVPIRNIGALRAGLTGRANSVCDVPIDMDDARSAYQLILKMAKAYNRKFARDRKERWLIRRDATEKALILARLLAAHGAWGTATGALMRCLMLNPVDTTRVCMTKWMRLLRHCRSYAQVLARGG